MTFIQTVWTNPNQKEFKERLKDAMDMYNQHSKVPAEPEWGKPETLKVVHMYSNGIVVGSAIIDVLDQKYKRAIVAFLTIKHEHQRQGVGTRFVELIQQYLSWNNTQLVGASIEIGNAGVADFWNKQGFKHQSLVNGIMHHFKTSLEKALPSYASQAVNMNDYIRDMLLNGKS